MGQAAMYLSVEGQRQPRVSKKWAQHPLPLQLCGELAIFFYCAQDDASPVLITIMRRSVFCINTAPVDPVDP